MTSTHAPLDVACQWGVVASELTAPLLRRLLPALAEVGYRRVVLPPVDPDRGDLRPLAAALADAGVSPIGMARVTAGAEVGSPDPDERARGIAVLRRAVAGIAALGGDQLNGVPYAPFGDAGRPSDPARTERAALAVGRVADEAHERGVAMTFEVLNRYETAMLNTARQAVAFVEASGSSHLRIHLDTYHMAIEEDEGIRAAVRIALPWLAYLELGQSGRAGLRDGAVDIRGAVAAALDDGYTGRWGVEAFTRASLADAVADRLAVWRSPYRDGIALAKDAQLVIRDGWAQSAVGRRARRLERIGADAGPARSG